MNLTQHLQSLHQDAVLWKGQLIWSKAFNPDAKVEASNKIANLLISIPNDIKRNAYLDRLTDSINEDLDFLNEKLVDLDSTIKGHEKSVAKLLKKKKLSAEDESELHDLPNIIEQLKIQLATDKSCLVSRIEKKEISRTIKEFIEQKQKAEQKKASRETSQSEELLMETLGLWNDFEGDVSLAKEYAIALYRGRYYAKEKNDWIEISNFSMRIIYHVNTGSDTAYRLISITNIFGIEKLITVNTDELVSVGSFKKILQRQGHFIFSGNDGQLSRLNDMLQKEEKPTTFVDILGYHPRGKFYAFANGLLDTADTTGNLQFHGIDDYGIVNLRERNYFIPAMSKMFLEKDELYQNEKKFVYVKNDSLDASIWSKLHFNVYGNNGLIGQLWLISALFRDVIYNINDIRCTPILNLYGQRGAGKTKYAESLMSIFGFVQPAITLGSHSTPKGFLRKFAQLRNAVVWLDEYKNNIKKDFIEALKNIYDGHSYTRAQKSNDFQTDSLPVSSACLLGGQEMPTVEPALFSRVLLLQFEPGKYDEDQRKNFKRLKNAEALGLSSIACEVLKHRPHFIESFKDNFDLMLKLMFEKVGDKNVDDRFIINISIMATIRKVLDGIFPFAFTLEQAEQTLIKNLKAQFSVMQGNDDIGRWWSIIEQLAAQGIIRHGRDWVFKNNLLCIRMNYVHPYYMKELIAQKDPNPLPKSTMTHYLENDKEAYAGYSKIRFSNKSNDLYDCYTFKYNILQDRYKIEMTVFKAKEEPSDSVEKSVATFGADDKAAPEWEDVDF